MVLLFFCFLKMLVLFWPSYTCVFPPSLSPSPFICHVMYLEQRGYSKGSFNEPSPTFSFSFFSIYLVASPLSCAKWDLWTSLCYVTSLVVACGIYVPDQGLNPGPLHSELSLSHWTMRKAPPWAILLEVYLSFLKGFSASKESKKKIEYSVSSYLFGWVRS